MDDITNRDPVQVRAEDINPRYNWGRALPALGIMGDVKFGADGEWTESRFIAVQYHGIKGDALDQFRGMNVQTIVGPKRFETGTLVYPYEKAR